MATPDQGLEKSRFGRDRGIREIGNPVWPGSRARDLGNRESPGLFGRVREMCTENPPRCGPEYTGTPEAARDDRLLLRIGTIYLLYLPVRLTMSLRLAYY
jgi:hypothetical protein